ncbi:MAG: hypothetical protein GQ557_01845 [Mycoplasmataceae bacterium]|nr:hypothetical protein [Mycoplasmataceae bacterium]
MAEIRKTKDLEITIDDPKNNNNIKKKPLDNESDLNKNKDNSLSPDKNGDSGFYEQQAESLSKKEKGFKHNWKTKKKFKYGIIAGLSGVLVLSLGLGLGFGLTGKVVNSFSGDDSGVGEWINSQVNTDVNIINELEDSAIIWAIDEEETMGILTEASVDKWKTNAEDNADTQIDSEKQSYRDQYGKHNWEDEWHNNLTALGFDSETEYRNSLISGQLSGHVADGFTDINDNTDVVSSGEKGNYEYVSLAANARGEYKVVGNDSVTNPGSSTDENPVEELFTLYLNMAKPVVFSQETLDFSLTQSSTSNSNYEWDGVTFADDISIMNTWIKLAQFDDGLINDDFELAEGSNMNVGGVNHFSSLANNTAALAYYASIFNFTSKVDDPITPDTEIIGDLVLTEPNATVDWFGNILNDASNYNSEDPESIDYTSNGNASSSDFNFDSTEINTINMDVWEGISGTQSGLSEFALFSNEKDTRLTGQQLTLTSKDGDDNTFILSTSSTSLQLTKVEDPETISTVGLSNEEYLFQVGTNMIDSDLEKSLNDRDTEFENTVDFGIWDDYTSWVTTNIDALVLNWAITTEDSDFLTNDEYHVSAMDDLYDVNDVGEITPTEDKGQDIINSFYDDMYISQLNQFSSLWNSMDDFYDENDQYILPDIRLGDPNNPNPIYQEGLDTVMFLSIVNSRDTQYSVISIAELNQNGGALNEKN